MNFQPQLPLLSRDASVVRASSQFARRLWCLWFDHRWNQTSIGAPFDVGGGTHYRLISGQQCLRCGEPGPKYWRRFDPIATYAALHTPATGEWLDPIPERNYNVRPEGQ